MASVSDTSVAPGQTVTVRASGLTPGGVSFIDYIPDGVRLATATAGADGSYVRDVQIPIDSPDGKKQIVVTAIAADGTYAYLPTDMTVRGPDAAFRLSNTVLRPGERLRISGTRFLSGSPVYTVLFPEQVVLATATPRPGGSFSVTVTVPSGLLNGRHGLVVTGLTAGGGYAYLQAFVTVSGGRGTVPGDRGYDPFPGSSAPSTTSTTSTSTTTPARAGGDSTRERAHTDRDLTVAVLIVVALAVLAIVGSWWWGPGGRRWRRRRRRHDDATVA